VPSSNYPPKAARRRPRALRIAVAAAVVAIAAAGCSAKSSVANDASGSQPQAAGTVGGTLTVAYSAVPLTLDPAKAVQNDSLYDALAYEPLIVRMDNGSLAPGLATSWRYLGNSNTEFQLQLRSGVQFSDGSLLTAQDVVNDLRYVLQSGGQMAPLFTGDTFSATGPRTVVIKTPQPNPDLPTLLTQDDVVGGIISPDGLKDTAKLGTETSGAGPYELDAAASVGGNYYTYVPNPHYYDKPAVHWHKVVVRAITSPQAVLNAMETGEVQFAVGDASTASAAQKAGLTVTTTPFLWTGVTLADRAGKMLKPLADVRVRQALNYATNRSAIASALFSGGRPTSELTVPGGYGYDPGVNDAYPYNVAKARQLLAAAGYPHGFTLPIVTADYSSMNLVAEALAQQWAEIGVKLKITDLANANQYDTDAFAPKFPAFMTIFGQEPIWTEGPSLFLPSALFNPFHTANTQLTELFSNAAKATGSSQSAADEAVEAWLVHQAWFVPVVTFGLPYYATKAVTGTSVSAQEPLASIYQVQPAQ
jgi:peptide/nickel transport system substrate-binding protein